MRARKAVRIRSLHMSLGDYLEEVRPLSLSETGRPLVLTIARTFRSTEFKKRSFNTLQSELREMLICGVNTESLRTVTRAASREEGKNL